MTHGTDSAYVNQACRCELCREAHRLVMRQRRKERFAQRIETDGRLIHPTATHGRPSTYSNYGCRCNACRRAWADAEAARIKRRIMNRKATA